LGEKPRVSAITSVKIEKVLALSPDLVLGFSDPQLGPAALTDGLARLRAIIDGWHAAKGLAQ
jgi:ABC-type Fe3+-hydroxamate transport system substrate-binding protein|tara:strand:- start:522 stop:707 length:186 start_codon:yes stop_codon:yes gene_type:complete